MYDADRASATAAASVTMCPASASSASDPLSQAMALTALVIGLAVTALLLALVLRVVRAYRSNALDDVAQEEAAHAERLERRDARAHEDEEAAAR